MAEGIALEAIRLIKENLPTATEHGKDLEARAQMLVASSMGATAFQRGLGGMHALAHPLGALYNAHHGMLNAILMPYVLKANQQAIEVRIARLANYLNLENATFEGFLNWVLALRETLKIPHSLKEIGIEADKSDQVGEMAVLDPSAAGNPIQFGAADYTRIFIDAVNGQLTIK